jgi:hypothetical protein
VLRAPLIFYHVESSGCTQTKVSEPHSGRICRTDWPGQDKTTGGHGENDQQRRKSLQLSLLSSRPKMRGSLRQPVGATHLPMVQSPFERVCLFQYYVEIGAEYACTALWHRGHQPTIMSGRLLPVYQEHHLHTVKRLKLPLKHALRALTSGYAGEAIIYQILAAPNPTFVQLVLPPYDWQLPVP